MSAILKTIFLNSLVLFSGAGTAFADSVTPPDHQVLELLAPYSRQTLSNSFDILVWNVHKGADKNAWALDLRNVSSGKELVLLQEAMKDDYMPSVLRGLPSFGWMFATSWIKTPEMFETGIASGSVASHIDATFRRSPGREPFTDTPKVTLITTYQLFSGEILKVANLHGINFVGLSKFQAQLDDVATQLQSHRGPLIFAGDFNTWNAGRMKAALAIVKKLGMTQVQFPNDTRTTKFDHIFVRGCSYSQAKILNAVKTSDHAPLTATLNCNPQR